MPVRPEPDNSQGIEIYENYQIFGLALVLLLPVGDISCGSKGSLP